MKHEDEFVEDTLCADDDADDLDAACRTARTSSDGHDDNRRHPERRTPSHVVELLGREAGTRRYAADVEQSRAERLLEAFGQGG